MWHAVANTALGHASYVVGDLDTALGVLPKSAYNETTPAQVRVLALGVLALAEAELGHYDRSRRSAFEAMQVVEARSLQALPSMPWRSPRSGKAKLPPETCLKRWRRWSTG